MTPTYHPDVFKVGDIAQAMAIILTAENSSTEHRWQIETPFVADLIGRTIEITSDSVLLDYGCGIGRLAKELIARHNCRVIGIDISDSMRALSVSYVGSDRFFSCSPPMLDMLIGRGLRFDAAISVWVLQHCLKPAEDIGLLRKGLKPGAGLFILNNIYRAVPTAERGWFNDQVDIKQTLKNVFDLQKEGELPKTILPSALHDLTYWAAFRNQPPARSGT